MRRHWQEVTAFAHRLRPQLSVPLFVEPPIYSTTPIVPLIDGVVKNSPAAYAGLRTGDIIRLIDQRPIRTRMESEATLDDYHHRGIEAFEIAVERDGELLRRRIQGSNGSSDTYPYSADHFYRGENYGIFHVEDFRLNHLQKLIEVVRRYQAKDVLLFSSAIVAPIFDTLVTAIPEFANALKDVNLHVEVIEENTFGGNYDLMDSRVVQDYARVIRKRLQQGDRFDLILIPDAFGSSWGIDVFGDCMHNLMQEFAVPVERIDWLLVYGREV